MSTYNKNSNRGGFESYFMKPRRPFGRRPVKFTGPKSRASRNLAPRGRGVKIDPLKFVNKAVTVDVSAGQPAPEVRFAQFGIDPLLKQKVVEKGYTVATPIQAKAIPQILSGNDVVGIADTGTGKTAAFLLPLIHKVLQNRKNRVIIVAPTRELAAQIDQELKCFANGLRIFSVCCVGGTNIGRQLSELRFANNFIVGTPGRLKDLIERKRINLAEFGTIVLDEADRMLDMGFIADMRFLMAGMPKSRQTLFFSATLSREIENLIGEFLRNPARILIKNRDTSKNVDQDIVKIGPDRKKIDVLRGLLSDSELSKVLIFGRTKHGVENLCKTLNKNGFCAESIHGNKNFSQRRKALERFKSDQVKILVATDVAARGLDISNVSHVINYDLPQTYEDYIHRIGRTGRADSFGKALTFID